MLAAVFGERVTGMCAEYMCTVLIRIIFLREKRTCTTNNVSIGDDPAAVWRQKIWICRATVQTKSAAMKACSLVIFCWAVALAGGEPVLQLPSWARSLRPKLRAGPVPDGTCDAVVLSPNTKTSCTAQDGDTCASIAYEFRLKSAVAVYIMRASSGALCGADDELMAGE